MHDWLNQQGGAENVLEALVQLYPDSPVYTSIYAPDKMPSSYRQWDIRTTWMNSLPGIHEHHQPYLVLYPKAFANLNLGDYDVVLTNKSGFCHGVQAGEAMHVCYCLAPTRYVWQFEAYMRRERFPDVSHAMIKAAVRSLQRWDFDAAQRVDHFVAISSDIQQRIERFYQRSSTIIFPPVETDRFRPTTDQDDYLLVVSRLIPYKRIDLAVRACTELGIPLKVVGSGRDRDRLEKLAGPTVEFLGRVPDEDLPNLYARCRGFIFPGLEDFGIAPVEAQAAGRPVIAYKAGGALDTVIEGETGTFFEEQSLQTLVQAIKRFNQMAFSPERCVVNAARFSRAVFDDQLTSLIETRYDAFLSQKRD